MVREDSTTLEMNEPTFPFGIGTNAAGGQCADASNTAPRGETKEFLQFSPQTSRWPALIRALRCHQWSKNILVFLPLIAGHAYFHGKAVVGALLMFVAWCMVASGIYISNDLLDLEADRRHPTKRLRPFASGDLPLWVGVAVAPLLLIAGLLLSAAISPMCATA